MTEQEIMWRYADRRAYFEMRYGPWWLFPAFHFVEWVTMRLSLRYVEPTPSTDKMVPFRLAHFTYGVATSMEVR